MTTEKQINANRRNAQRSTGPRTEAGRRISSRNAVRHGLTAEEVTIDKKEARQFEAFRQDIFASLCPEGAIEEQLAERIAICWWRLRRSHRIEAMIISERNEARVSELAARIYPWGLEKPSPGTISEGLITGPLQQLTRYETAIERSLHRALHELERWQARRRGDAVMAPFAVDVTHSKDQDGAPTVETSVRDGRRIVTI